MIIASEVMPLLLQACPSFQRRWAAYVLDPTYDESFLYIHLAEFARHLVDLAKQGATDEFSAVFQVVERLHLEGHPYVSEAATIGLLEGIQNVAGNSGMDPERFVPHLGPESSKWWAQLNAFWAGEIPYVGASLKHSKD